jgi:hypothetical protein
MNDLGFAFGKLRQSPAFTSVAVISIGIYGAVAYTVEQHCAPNNQSRI